MGISLAPIVRSCFRELERLSIRRGDRWLEHGPVTADRIVSILLDRGNKGAAFDTKRNRELVATGEILNGTYEINEGATRFRSNLAFPLDRDSVAETIEAVCDLARVLEVGSGFVAVDTCLAHAQTLMLGGEKPKERPACQSVVGSSVAAATGIAPNVRR